MTSDQLERFMPPREKLVFWLKRLYRHRLTTTTGGNLSLIDDDGMLYITPSGGDKALVHPSEVATCEPGSKIFEGFRSPSMEWRLHTLAYSVRPDCKAVLHAHSMALIAFSLAAESDAIKSHCMQKDNHPGVPDTRCLMSAWMTCGKVAFAPYFPPGSEELSKSCANMLSQADCVILQNHGVITIGSSLQQAFDRFVTLENLAQTIIHAIPIGIPHPLKIDILDIKEQRNIKYQKLLRSIPLIEDSSRVVTCKEKVTRAELCRFVRRAYEQNIFTSSSGSISIRVPYHQKECKNSDYLPDLSFVITPSNVDRYDVDPSTLCFVTTNTNIRGSNGNIETEDEQEKDNITKLGSNIGYHQTHSHIIPSHTSEVHHTIYSMHPEIKSIIIAQPPFTTSFCITGTGLNSDGIPESHLVLGKVKTLPIECLEDAGVMLSQVLNPASGINTVLIDGFGVLSVADCPLKAYTQVEVCESICGIMLTAMRRGQPRLLSNDQVKEIDYLFKGGH